jgi:uncharacterized membrane protein YphA (DoxX/SURF4 family)
MNGDASTSGRHRVADLLAVAVRWVLAAVFIYMGATKALHPEEFLKLVRQYGMVDHPLLLNLAAAILPWFEVFCGSLLLAGVAVRGTAVLLVGMLVPFTGAILLRALAIQAAGGSPFCAIAFDCGCGGGEVFVCRKLAENAGLTVLAGWLVYCPRLRWCVRPVVIGAFHRPGGVASSHTQEL